MYISIKYKVFLAILLANILLASAMFALSIWNFKRGFIDYLNQSEAQKLEPLSQALMKEYNSQNGWGRLQDEHWRWRHLLATHVLEQKKVRHLPSPHDHMPAMVDGKSRHKNNERRAMKMPLTFDPRILLLDADKNVLIGQKKNKGRAEFRPLVSGEKTVGYLGIVRRNNVSGDIEKLFVQKQQNSMAMIMLFLLLLAGFIALPLALHLVKPIRQLLDATRSLIAGKYNTRIMVRQKDELGSLAVDFNYLAKTLEENQKVRQQWIADISHELRTPLAILQGEVEAMQDNVRPLNRQTLESLAQEIRQLSGLVNDLHDLSVSDLGGLCYKKTLVDVVDIMSSVAEAFSHTLTMKHISLKLTSLEKAVILADAQRLEQLFNNLMQNTLRYTDESGQLEIEIRADKDNVSIYWRDSSPGVDDKHLEKLFDRFYRVDNKVRNRENGGSGLGLAICHNIIKAHNGSVSARHSRIGGLEIVISLPVSN